MTVADLNISIHTESEISKIAAASRIVADVLNAMKGVVKPGVSTLEIDAVVEDIIRSKGAEPAFKGYEVDGKIFPSSACISIDEEVVHGMPGQRTLKEGQIVTVDVGVRLDGYYGDSAYTYGVGEISTDKQRLLDATKEALRLGIEQATDGNRVYDIAKAVQTHIEKQGFSVVRELVGHGIGSQLHLEPPVPNFVPGLLHRSRFPNARLKTGMALAIEPMVNMGLFHVHTASDGWTVYTADGKPSAHFEHTIVIDGTTPRILTAME